MEPSKVASSLREIADRIDRSERPSKARVSAAIRVVLAGMGETTTPDVLDDRWPAILEIARGYFNDASSTDNESSVSAEDFAPALEHSVFPDGTGFEVGEGPSEPMEEGYAYVNFAKVMKDLEAEFTFEKDPNGTTYSVRRMA